MNCKVIEPLKNNNLAVMVFASSRIASSGLSSTYLDDVNDNNVPISENINDAARDDDDTLVEPDDVKLLPDDAQLLSSLKTNVNSNDKKF